MVPRQGAASVKGTIEANAVTWARRTLFLAGHGLALWITASVFLVFNEPFQTHNGVGYDEGFFVWGGWSILKGLAPYKDFLEFKPPVVFLTHALAQKLFGFEHFGFRRFFTIFPLASILTLQASLVLRKIDAVLAAALTVSLVALFVNSAFHDTALSDSESIGMSYFLLGLAFLLAETRYRNATDAIGAAFMTCAVFSKEPFAPGVLATWASVFVLRDGVGRFRTNALRYIKFTGLGALVIVLGLCVYMIPTGSMKAYIQTASSYSRIYRNPKLSYCVVLGVFHPSTPMSELATQWEGVRRQFLNLDTLGFMAPFFAAAVVYIPRRSPLLMATTCAGLVGAIWAVTASNCQWPHYYTMTLAGFFAFLVIGLDAMAGAFRACDRWTRAFIRIAVAATVAVTVYPRYEAQSHIVHPPPVALEPVPGIFAFIATHTTPTDRILTTGPPSLYVYTNRLNAIREGNVIDEIIGIYQGDTDEERFRPIREELVKSMPKVVFLDPEHADRKRRHMNSLINPFLTEFHYRKENEYIYVRP
jgi:hypothetical protein